MFFFRPVRLCCHLPFSLQLRFTILSITNSHCILGASHSSSKFLTPLRAYLESSHIVKLRLDLSTFIAIFPSHSSSDSLSNQSRTGIRFQVQTTVGVNEFMNTTIVLFSSLVSSFRCQVDSISPRTEFSPHYEPIIRWKSFPNSEIRAWIARPLFYTFPSLFSTSYSSSSPPSKLLALNSRCMSEKLWRVYYSQALWACSYSI